MKRIVVLFILILIVIGCVVYNFQNACRGYSCLSFENKQEFTETEQIENTNASYKGILTRGGIRIRVEVYSASSQTTAKQYTQAKIMQLQGLFENARSPYPGVISNEIVCEDRFKPLVKDTIINGIQTATVVGYLNDRLQYGSCLEEQLIYTGKTVMFYCADQKKWYYFEAIAKKSDTNLDKETTHLIQSLKCQKSF